MATHFAGAHPGVTVRIIEADPEECFELLLADEAGLAVVVATATLPPSTDPRFDQRPLLDDPLDLLVPPAIDWREDRRCFSARPPAGTGSTIGRGGPTTTGLHGMCGGRIHSYDRPRGG